MPDASGKARKQLRQLKTAGSSTDAASGSAGKEAVSSELAREINRDVILDLIRHHQPVSRVELARASGLQNSTVSSIAEQLLAEGWISEGEVLRTARGRRPTQISLHASPVMLAADVHFARAVIAVVNLNGEVLESEDIALAQDVSRGVDHLAEALALLRARHPNRIFIGAGICLPGRVDRATGRIVLAPNLNWGDYDVQKVLAKRLQMSVELENDANASLLSELWFGDLRRVHNVVMLAISEGVGAALLVSGNLIGGRLGMAGEIGHLCFDAAGPVCGCGRRGCWEMFASTSAALRYYHEGTHHAALTDYRQLTQMAEQGNGEARAALERQAEAIGRGLRIVTASLDPDIILFAGEISLSWPLALPILERACRAGMLAGSPPLLLCAVVTDVAHLRGAAAVVLQRHSTYYRSRSTRSVANPRGQATPNHGKV